MKNLSLLIQLLLLAFLASHYIAANSQCKLCHAKVKHKQTAAQQTQRNINQLRLLTMDQLKKLGQSQHILIVDARSFSQMTKAVIKNTIWIGYFTEKTWNNWFSKNVEKNKKLVLYGSNQEITPVFSILHKLDYKNIAGKVDFDIMDWKGKQMPCEEPEYIEQITPNMTLLDVRSPFQWKAGVVKGSTLIQLGNIVNEIDKLDKNKTYVLVCRNGCRANIAMRILKPFGLKLKVYNHPIEQIFKQKWCQKVKP